MKLLNHLHEILITEQFINPKRPKSDQIAGNNIVYNVQDLLNYATRNLRVTSIPLSKLILNVPPFSLPGDSDEPDNSPEFQRRVSGLTLRDYIDGSKYPPILVIKRLNGNYEVYDGRHRVVTYVKLLKRANKNPLMFSVKGFIMDERLLRKMPSITLNNN